MRHEKQYLFSFRSGRGSYPSTVIVTAYNKEEAKSKIRNWVRSKYGEYGKSDMVKWDLVDKEVENLIFHFGIVMNPYIITLDD